MDDPRGAIRSRTRAGGREANVKELVEQPGAVGPSNAELPVGGLSPAERLPGTAVLVTRGAGGSTLFGVGEGPLALPAATARSRTT